MFNFEFNTAIILILGLGILFFVSCIYMLRWASRNGQFRDLEASAKMIFTDEEPEGVGLDAFPGAARKREPAAVEPK